MARPGFVHEVNDRTPALAVHSGTGVHLERFRHGTKVLYGPQPTLPGAPVRTSVADALAAPVAGAPLADRLRPGMRLTIAFSGAASTVPALREPDPRGIAVEEVLTLAAAAGVDDVELVCARGLGRRFSDTELQQVLGRRVHESFAPSGRISQHDATDGAQLTEVGEADGRPVAVNGRVAGSDLVIMVTVTDSAALAGPAGLATGLGSEATISALRQPGADAAAADRVGRVIAESVDVFAVEVAVEVDPFGSDLSFLAKREWEWNLKEQAVLAGTRGVQRVLPYRARGRMLRQARSRAGVVSAVAGPPEATGAVTVRQLTEGRAVPLAEQVDVLLTGTGHVSRHGVGAELNPLLAAHLGLHTAYGSHTGTPVVRDGGAMIIFDDAEPRFHRHHVATADFFAAVLPEGNDPTTVASHEDRFAEDDWYRHLYRTSEAHHARQPFHLWYDLEPARSALTDVVWVGGNREVCQLMGFRAASTLGDALEMVGAGQATTLAYLHNPPYAVADVAGSK
ncbi:lactate racemase domain-containing protein [Propionibacteriaceae bacterium Y2011]